MAAEAEERLSPLFTGRQCSTNAASFANCATWSTKHAMNSKAKRVSTIYQAESATQARERLTRWTQHWRERAPKAVATLECDFEQTLVSYSLESVVRE